MDKNVDIEKIKRIAKITGIPLVEVERHYDYSPKFTSLKQAKKAYEKFSHFDNCPEKENAFLAWISFCETVEEIITALNCYFQNDEKIRTKTMEMALTKGLSLCTTVKEYRMVHNYSKSMNYKKIQELALTKICELLN